MRFFNEPEPDYGKEALTFALGAAGGLALGLLVVRGISAPKRVAGLGDNLRDRARTVAGRLRPARLRRMVREQRQLTALEDEVLEAFFADAVLSERGIDVGAISPGIVELSGSVWTDDEADQAVRVASRVEGVRTVVNRMEIEDRKRQEEAVRRRVEEGGGTVLREASRVGGMGSRRQSPETDPDRPDDSQHMAMGALDRADRDQQADEGFASAPRRVDEQPWRENFDSDDVEPQDPHGGDPER